MPWTTRRWISKKLKSLRESHVLPFHDILDAWMVDAALAAEGARLSERISTLLVTACLFLSQVLDPDHSCRAATAGRCRGISFGDWFLRRQEMPPRALMRRQQVGMVVHRSASLHVDKRHYPRYPGLRFGGRT
jgi:hypothetical protein